MDGLERLRLEKSWEVLKSVLEDKGRDICKWDFETAIGERVIITRTILGGRDDWKEILLALIDLWTVDR